MIKAWLVSHWVPILLAVVLLAEAALLAWIWRKYQQGMPLHKALPFLGSGLFFALALFAMVVPQKPFLLAFALLGAFLSHILDFKQRWDQ